MMTDESWEREVIAAARAVREELKERLAAERKLKEVKDAFFEAEREFHKRYPCGGMYSETQYKLNSIVSGDLVEEFRKLDNWPTKAEPDKVISDPAELPNSGTGLNLKEVRDDNDPWYDA